MGIQSTLTISRDHAIERIIQPHVDNFIKLAKLRTDQMSDEELEYAVEALDEHGLYNYEIEVPSE